MTLLIINKLPLDVCDYGQWLSEFGQKLELIQAPSAISMHTNGSPSDFLNKIDVNHYVEKYEESAGVELQMFNSIRKEKPSAIVAMSEFDLILAARFRSFFSILGQSLESALNFRDKLRMKKNLLKAKNFKVPKFKVISSSIDLLEYAKINTYPFVLKSRFGAGSSDVWVIKDRKDLEETIVEQLSREDDLDKDLMVEEFIEGEMYHVDGYSYLGKVKESLVSKYLNGCLAYRDNVPLGSHLVEQQSSMSKKLVKSVQESIELLDPNLGSAFHAEFFVTKENEVYICEIASRVGAVFQIRDVFEKKLNIDIFKMNVLLQSQHYYAKESEYKHNALKVYGWVIVPPKKGFLVEIPKKCDFTWVSDYRHCQDGTSFAGAEHSVSELCSAIIEAENEKQFKERFNEFYAWVEEKSIWIYN